MLPFFLAVLLCVAPALAFDPLATMKLAKRSVEREMWMRVKRQSSNGTAPNKEDAAVAMECMQKCEPQMDYMLQVSASSQGLNTSGSFEGRQFMGQDTKQQFDPNNLDKICTRYKEVRRCFESCPQNPMVAIIVNAFSPLDYICVEKFDQFRKYGECTWRAFKKGATQCDTSCGNDTAVTETLVQRPANAQLMSLALGKLCRMGSCETECIKPHLVEECKKEEPALMYKELVKRAIGVMLSTLEQFQMGHVVPNECAAFNSTNETVRKPRRSPIYNDDGELDNLGVGSRRDDVLPRVGIRNPFSKAGEGIMANYLLLALAVAFAYVMRY